MEVPDDLDVTSPVECQVVSTPSTSWPFFKPQDMPRQGVLTGLSRISMQGAKPLKLFSEWLPTELASTGSIFLNPRLRIGVGDVLIVERERGVSRYNVSRPLMTVQAKLARSRPAPVPVQTVPMAYSLLGAELGEEGDE